MAQSNPIKKRVDTPTDVCYLNFNGNTCHKYKGNPMIELNDILKTVPGQVLKGRGLTLLERFIVRKAYDYNPPERKGTPKGEPVGFSREKYNATLLSLTRTSIKEIAETVKVSYAGFKRWRTEQNFKDEINSHIQEFSKIFTENFIDGELKVYGENSENCKDIISGKKLAEDFAFDPYKDMMKYSTPLLREISVKAIGLLKYMIGEKPYYLDFLKSFKSHKDISTIKDVDIDGNAGYFRALLPGILKKHLFSLSSPGTTICCCLISLRIMSCVGRGLDDNHLLMSSVRARNTMLIRVRIKLIQDTLSKKCIKKEDKKYMLFLTKLIEDDVQNVFSPLLDN